MNLICRHLNANEPAGVLWMCFSEELAEQACEEFERAWSHLGNRPVSIRRYFRAHPFEPVEDGIIVAGLSKLWNAAKNDLQFTSSLATTTDLIVFDEAHQAPAETTRPGGTYDVEPPRAVGPTATPGRAEGDDENLRSCGSCSPDKVALDVEV